MNKYAESLGFPTAMFQFHEIFSTEVSRTRDFAPPATLAGSPSARLRLACLPHQYYCCWLFSRACWGRRIGLWRW